MNMDLIKAINKCEDDYISCFCEIKDEGKYKVYKDDAIKDMYDHNFMYIKENVDKSEIEDMVKEETRRCKHKEFCKIRLPYYMDKMPVSYNGDIGEVEHLGAYVYKEGSIENWKTISGCVIEKVEDDKNRKAFIDNDIRIDAVNVGKDFCIRRSQRLWDIYLDKNKLCNLYICYYDNKPVGSCELFLNGDIAKIESFSVDPEYQRRGIGTMLLKYLVNTAIEYNAKTIYLVADEDDTAKEMYLKLGFNKVLDKYAVLWKN